MEKSERCSPEKWPRSEEKILMEGFTMNATTKQTDREALLDRIMDMLPLLTNERIRYLYIFLIHFTKDAKKDGDKGDT